MDPITQPQNNQSQMKPKTSAKDFFLNLGAIVALFVVVGNLIDLLFTVINTAYPQITPYYAYSSSASISFPVATLIIFFPIFVLLMWLLEREYKTEPAKKQLGVRKWLTYITLFIAGLTLAGDLVSVLYYFIDGQELTPGFLLKVLTVFVIALAVFMYYITDIREKMTARCRTWWTIGSVVLILASIIWGFSVLGSPRTQQLLKYDEQKVSDLQNLNNDVDNYFRSKGSLPSTLSDLANSNNYYNTLPTDPQTHQSYEYVLVGQSAKAYQLCATFNKVTPQDIQQFDTGDLGSSWIHPAGRYCFNESIPLNEYPPVPATVPAKLPM